MAAMFGGAMYASARFSCKARATATAASNDEDPFSTHRAAARASRCRLRAWRLASGRPDDGALVFPGIDGRTGTREAWKSWTRRTWAEAWKAASTGRGERTPRVYDLRHSFVSLLLAEGRAIHYVAAQACHDAQFTLSTFGHLLAEYADGDRIDAEEEIAGGAVSDAGVVWSFSCVNSSASGVLSRTLCDRTSA
jgi:hypothetical protein